MKRKLFRAQQEMSDNIFQVNSIKKLRSHEVNVNVSYNPEFHRAKCYTEYADGFKVFLVYSSPIKHNIATSSIRITRLTRTWLLRTSYDVYQLRMSSPLPRERLTLKINFSRKQRNFSINMEHQKI